MKVPEEERDGICWQGGPQGLWMLGDPCQPAGSDGEKPDDHHGPEEAPAPNRANALGHKQAEDNKRGARHGPRFEAGSTTFSPSTAERTEMAGVIMLSPKNRAAPKTPSDAKTSFVRVPSGTTCCLIRVISARMPPSPSLSARITSSTYFSVTIMVTDQSTMEIKPWRKSVVAAIGCGSSGLKIVELCTSGWFRCPQTPLLRPRLSRLPVLSLGLIAVGMHWRHCETSRHR